MTVANCQLSHHFAAVDLPAELAFGLLAAVEQSVTATEAGSTASDPVAEPPSLALPETCTQCDTSAH